MTPTAVDQFDVSSVQASVIAGLTADSDLLWLVEGQLTPHLADFTSLTVAGVSLDAQGLRVWYQWLPNCGLVATPAEGHEISVNRRDRPSSSHTDAERRRERTHFCARSAP